MKITKRQLQTLIYENVKDFMKDFEAELAATKDLPLGTDRGDDYPAQFDPDYLFKGRPRESDNLPVGRGAYYVKKLWNKYADRKWVDSLVKIHWVPSLVGFASSGVTPKDELSCATYTQQEYNNLSNINWSGVEAGLVLEGYTTFLSPGTSNPGFFRHFAKDPNYIKSKKSSGISRLPLLFGQNISPEMADMMEQGAFLYNEESWDKVKNIAPNEIIESYVDNWRISQVVFASTQEYRSSMKSYDDFVEMANENDLLTKDFVVNRYKNPKILK
jgi:hypothetical protein